MALHNSILTDELVKAVCGQYRLDLDGPHGIKHWARVYDIGLKIAGSCGADTQIVELFALFHDCCRVNNHGDRGHGKRGAELAAMFQGRYFDIAGKQWQLLDIACSMHTDARTHPDVTVQVCFDADRLDLGRVGKYPDPFFLSTDLARQEEMIIWAYRRSIENHLPANPHTLNCFL
jgi:uncharacterized protein